MPTGPSRVERPGPLHTFVGGAGSVVRRREIGNFLRTAHAVISKKHGDMRVVCCQSRRIAVVSRHQVGAGWAKSVGTLRGQSVAQTAESLDWKGLDLGHGSNHEIDVRVPGGSRQVPPVGWATYLEVDDISRHRCERIIEQRSRAGTGARQSRRNGMVKSRRCTEEAQR